MAEFAQRIGVLRLGSVVVVLGSTGATLGDSGFLASGGQVVAEAEHFTYRSHVGTGQHWGIVPDEHGGAGAITGFRGTGFVQALLDVGAGNTPNDGPIADYVVRITQSGQYRLFLRAVGHDPGSDSVYAKIVELDDGLGGTRADWYRFALGSTATFNTTPWLGDASFETTNACCNDTAAVWTLGPGDYTVRIDMREDGCAVDAFVLQLVALAPPTGIGPAESSTFALEADRRVWVLPDDGAWSTGANWGPTSPPAADTDAFLRLVDLGESILNNDAEARDVYIGGPINDGLRRLEVNWPGSLMCRNLRVGYLSPGWPTANSYGFLLHEGGDVIVEQDLELGVAATFLSAPFIAPEGTYLFGPSGHLMVGGNVKIGQSPLDFAPSTNLFEQWGGTFEVAGDVRVGNYGGKGRIVLKDGLIDVDGTLKISVAQPPAPGVESGVLELHEGAVHAGALYVGFGPDADGKIVQHDGAVEVDGLMVLGLGPVSFGPAKGGRYDLLGGTLFTHEAIFGGSYGFMIGFQNGHGEMLVDGAVWTNETGIGIGGNESSGKLDVVNGGCVLTDSITMPGAEGSGELTVIGPKSLVLCSGPLSIGVGPVFPRGILKITDGGTVHTNGGTIGMPIVCDSCVGIIAADANISGEGSRWSAEGQVTMGGLGRTGIFPTAEDPRLIVSNDGLFEADSLKVLPFGHVHGDDGVVRASVINMGEIAPGLPQTDSSFGVLTIDGSLIGTGSTPVNSSTGPEVQFSGQVTIDIAGVGPGVTHDVLHITGDLLGAGELFLNLKNGYTPPLGQTFVIGTYGNLVAPFGLVRSTPFSGDHFLRVSYVPDALAGSSGTIVVTVESLTDLLGFDDADTVGIDGLPTSIAVGNFDDIITPNGVDLAITVPGPQFGDVLVMLNGGLDIIKGGWLGFTEIIQVSVGFFPTTVAVKDFDGVNGDDLAVSNLGSQSVTVLVNSGRGSTVSFSKAQELSIDGSPDTVASADFDGDGDNDLAVAVPAPQGPDLQGPINGGFLYIFLNQGAAAFTPNQGLPAGDLPIDVEPAGIDRNKDVDLACQTVLEVPDPNNPDFTISIPKVAVYLNNGQGFFIGPVFFDVGGVSNEIEIGDLDLDGLTDVVATNATNSSITILLNDGNGGLQGPLDQPIGGVPLSIDVADLDNDGDLDISAVVDIDQGVKVVRILENLIDGGIQLQFAQPVDADTGQADPLLVISADVDQDEKKDLIAVTEEPSALAGGTFSAMHVLLNTTPTTTCLADLSHDGVVNVEDLFMVIADWGPCFGCPADLNNDGAVNIDDLFTVIEEWGDCPG